MATFSKPLVSAAALAGAAAVALATPAVMPSAGVPSPGALSRAAYELTTFSDVLSIPTERWTDVLFGNDPWGGALSSEFYGPEWAKPEAVLGQANYVNPWAALCDGKCKRSFITGVSYMFFDALVNGNGNGYADYENWPIGIVNYFFEPATAAFLGGGNVPQVQFSDNGFSAATWFALQGTLGEAVPALKVPIAALFWGPSNLALAYNVALDATAAIVRPIPLVGPFVSDSIKAYLGKQPFYERDADGNIIVDENGNLQVLGLYDAGLSGVLKFWVDIATGATPFPTASVAPAAASVRGAVAEAPEAVPAPSIAVGEPNPSGAGEEAPAAEESDKAPAVEVSAEAPAAEASDDAPAAEASDDAPAGEVAVDAPAAEAAVDTTPAVPAETTEPLDPEMSVDPAPEATDPEPTPADDSEPATSVADDVAAAVKEEEDAADAASAKAGSGSSAGGEEKAATQEPRGSDSAKADSDSAGPGKADSAGASSAGEAG